VSHAIGPSQPSDFRVTWVPAASQIIAFTQTRVHTHMYACKPFDYGVTTWLPLAGVKIFSHAHPWNQKMKYSSKCVVAACNIRSQNNSLHCSDKSCCKDMRRSGWHTTSRDDDAAIAGIDVRPQAVQHWMVDSAMMTWLLRLPP
jgi:hypothetical protein